MELKQLFSVIKRRWWLVLLPAVVALLLSIPAIPAMLRPPLGNRVTLRFSASQLPKPDQTPSFEEQSYIAWLGSEYAVTNLATWLRTDSFAQEVSQLAAQQGVSVSAEDLRGAIVSDPARSIITLYIDWPDAEQLKIIAKAAVEALQTRNAAYFGQFGGQAAQVIPLDTVHVALVAPPVTQRLAPLLRVALGLAAGLVLAFLVEYLDSTLRTRHEVEELGLTVIGEIPRL